MAVVTGERLGPESDLGFRASQLGALDFMSKPSLGDEGSMTCLRAQVRALAGTPVFLHAGDQADIRKTGRSAALPDAPPFSIVAIAAGAGGPKSVAAILRSLPENFGAPVVVVQQVPDLQEQTSLRVQSVGAHQVRRCCEPREHGAEMVRRHELGRSAMLALRRQ